MMQSRIFRGALLIAGVSSALTGAIACILARGFIGDSELRWVFYVYIFISVCAVTICSSFLVWQFASLVTKPLRGSTEAAKRYSELTPLLRRIEDQRKMIRESESERRERENGLSTIMDYMTEGIVLLDLRAIVVSMNKSARTLLGAPEGSYTGRHIFALCREPILQAAVHSAQVGEFSENLLEICGCMLRITVNPVRVDNAVRGIVLFIFDVTETHAVEKIRREFSANVSHELKTPLTSITGFAEIIKDGMVKPQDIPRFAENIYNESKRLLRLVEDIIRLSKLDESQHESEKVEISLLQISNQVLESISPTASQYNVTVNVDGEDAVIEGDPLLLFEMVYNLCDNAIKYNKPEGSVEISVGRDKNGPVLSVKDTGIGIPREHQDRVFERFYRIDKSHSKATGGTGLGLSIVKHGAKYHGAEIELESVPGQGSLICLHFNGEKK